MAESTTITTLRGKRPPMSDVERQRLCRQRKWEAAKVAARKSAARGPSNLKVP
jgi:hypothetical protein